MTHTLPGPTVSAPRPVTPIGILAAALTDISSRLATIDGVDDDLRAQLRRAIELAAGLDPYLGRCTTPESPALRSLAARTAAHDWAGPPETSDSPALEQEMLSGHIEGQILKFLVRLTRARRVLDVGMFTGYSALAMAEALPDDGEVVACELVPSVARFAEECFAESPCGDKITVRVGPALTTLEQLARDDESFDVVFIDADKAGYIAYLDAVLDTGLLAPGGLVCVDNTLMQGQPYTSGEPTANGAAIAAFNAALTDDPRVEQVLIPVRDGLTLIRRV
jgi:caffeoyl-CoA O-methyltransferase